MQRAVRFHISLAADLPTSFHFCFVGGKGPKYFEASKRLKKQQTPQGNLGDAANQQVINKATGQRRCIHAQGLSKLEVELVKSKCQWLCRQHQWWGLPRSQGAARVLKPEEAGTF